MMAHYNNLRISKFLKLSRGDSATATTVLSGGEWSVVGSATSTTVQSGGYMKVHFDGSATLTTIQDGGCMMVGKNSIVSQTLGR